MTPEQYSQLFRQLLNGKLSPKDTQALVEWLGNNELDPVAAEAIMQQLQQSVPAEQIDPALIARLESKLSVILVQKKQAPVVALFNKKWMRYAAILIVMLAGALVYLQYHNKPQQILARVNTLPAKNDITPGKEGAILTLDGGGTVVLDSMGNGFVADQDGSRISLKNGQLVYDANGVNAGKIAYNTMSTPKGRQFRVTLPDGTQVWLNAASSLRYPTAFVGKDRRVEITGEAYFEVAKDPTRPFHVKINGKTEVEVLGTHFNINAYQNEESINTTLLEGSVKVHNGNQKTVIKPGQQAQVANTIAATGIIKVNDNVDIDRVMAWKNGVFDFNDATLVEVMKQLERWYDIEVVYEKGVPPFEFVGKMQKNLSLSEVLRGLEVSKVHFRTEDRKLIVLP
ncbi:anti-FecI sigma factor, FecR [Russula earlei]|uniref:Anti-FecI sigma factor, FecR n=1 Tax=Russula earlei TaxID=71964 RepID=A0ACC0TZ58_9AGAM|nr:anti-FecI sigma factor, FecR [Russula earlei]